MDNEARRDAAIQAMNAVRRRPDGDTSPPLTPADLALLAAHVGVRQDGQAATYADAHYATFPPELIRPCILAGSRPGDTVADPFCGSGTTWQVAAEERRAFVGCDLDERSRAWAAARLARVQTRMGWEATA